MLTFPRWKKILIFFVVLSGVLTAAPNFLSDSQRASLPGFLPGDTLSLGLDLRGGLHMLIEAETDDVIEARLNNIVDQVEGLERSVSGLNFTRPLVENETVIFAVTRAEMLDLARKELQAIVEPDAGLAGITGTAPKELELSSEGNEFRITLTEAGVRVEQREAVARSIEVIRNRIDPEGVKEITLAPEGDNRFILQVPGAVDASEYETVINKTAKLGFHEVDLNVSADDIERRRVGRSKQILPLSENGQTIGQMVVGKRAIVSGEDLEDAKPTFDERGQPAVSFRFNTRGAKRFADYTRANVGLPFAIVLDNTIISAPNIQVPILGGSGIITNIGDIAEAQELAVLLKSGALPVKLTIASQGVISAELGSESVSAGQWAAIIGFIAVIIYMIVSYGGFGLAANVALITNLILIIGALSLLQATLTLPGIAGIVLTIGMAVDANVLIFERIREEQRGGRGPFKAMEEGYSQAFSTIIDANITTFIAAALLYMLGSGPVQGFAVTLAIGILTSMFTAVVLTRFILSSWLTRKRPAVLPI